MRTGAVATSAICAARYRRVPKTISKLRSLVGRTSKRERERTPWLRMVSAFCVALTGVLTGLGRPGPELTLASGAFLVGYLKRFGVLGAGIGSQIYIGQLLAYGARLLRLI